MINYKELRWGNWINVDGQPYTVNGAFLDQIEKKNCTWRKNVAFIPLTPEILESISIPGSGGELVDFVIGSQHGIKDIGLKKIPIVVKKDRIVGIEGYYLVGGGRYDPAINYLHQLQNLYFALTGEELAINL